MPNIDDLQFERFYDVNFIPRELIDQMDKKNYSTDRFYQIGPILLANPLSYLYVLTTSGHVIKGILWCSVELMSQQLHLNIFSVDPDYQAQGTDNKTREAVIAFMKKLVVELNESEIYQKAGIHLLDTIVGITTHPKAWESTGYKQSKRIIMEG